MPQIVSRSGRASGKIAITCRFNFPLGSGARRAIGGLTPLAELADPHPVNPLADHDLGMLAIADLAAEDTGTAFPAHRLAGTKSRAYPAWRRSRAQPVALACLPRLASR